LQKTDSDTLLLEDDYIAKLIHYIEELKHKKKMKQRYKLFMVWSL